MKTINAIRFLGAISIVAFLSGCFDEKMPEVNDINCQHGNILKIEDTTMQQEFTSKCLRRGEPRSGKFKASPKREW